MMFDVDGRPNRRKQSQFSNKNGYVGTGPRVNSAEKQPKHGITEIKIINYNNKHLSV